MPARQIHEEAGELKAHCGRYSRKECEGVSKIHTKKQEQKNRSGTQVTKNRYSRQISKAYQEKNKKQVRKTHQQDRSARQMISMAYQQKTDADDKWISRQIATDTRGRRPSTTLQ